MTNIATQQHDPQPNPSTRDPLNEQVYQRLRWGLTVGTYRPVDKISIRSLA